ncbi:endonuclease domain-containing protein [Sphingomonas xinjiangensis]|uniref:Very-short-patch-repair endonuclease n=1 Tax=Sphingomonas xinjiangensis TaxID=643568 RepID=A0A840YHR3_9SPHN|nr:DUF559 domain-containing protein [Sphingomonas xinjiangensis]MBB5711915.1 very-short-patch-repair endonuclease [Sphingomonas xinjiangensis]
MLRAKQFDNVKFARQVVIAPYIADFAARSTRLVVEVDGDTHALRDAYDARRTHWLEAQGYTVIRFTNHDTATNLEGVAQAISEALKALSPPGRGLGEGKCVPTDKPQS